LTALKLSCYLGFKYVIGKDVKQDDFKALKFYQKACGLNDGTGCFNLGFMYKEGKGVKQDNFKALKFYQKACVKLLYQLGFVCFFDFYFWIREYEGLHNLVCRVYIIFLVWHNFYNPTQVLNRV
jgi:hypothetical protein